MKEVKRNLQESLVLHNLFVSIYPKMQKEKDKEFYKFVRLHTRTNYSSAANAVLQEVSVNLIKEIMVLLNQVWVDNSRIFDESLTKDKRLYNSIKAQIANGEKFPFNNKELYKRIRQAIAHNSKDVENFVYNLKTFELNLGQVDGVDYVVNLDFSQILNLLKVLLENVKEENNPIQFHVNETKTFKTREEIFENIKMVNGEEEIDLDDNQIDRIHNYFRFLKPDVEVKGNERLISKMLCLPKNADRLLYEKLDALKVVATMTSKSSWSNMQVGDNVSNINTYFAIVSNLLFTLVASRTNDELETLLDGCVPSLNKTKIRHLRNSLCHGKYFHDFNTTFYFYDGKDPTFKLELNIKDINKILDKLAKGQYNVAIMP